MPDRRHPLELRVCVNCVMDGSDPDIQFDADGICSHCRMYEGVAARLLEPAEAQVELARIVEHIKHVGRGQPYDCLIGLSGGVDSSYVAYQAKQLGLRPLAFHFDNGWDSERAVHNIEMVLRGLDLDLFTYVVDWEEFRDLQVSFFRASVIDIEMLTDQAIAAVSLQVARKRGIRYIVRGTNLRTEAIMPLAWVHNKLDIRNVRAIHARHGTGPIGTFPSVSTIRQRAAMFANRIEMVSLLDYLAYDKADAVRTIHRALGWQEYGGKHHESIFTRFYQGYILPTKFGVDKRRAHLSTLVCSGQITRDEALRELEEDPYHADVVAEDRAYVLKKLALSEQEFAAYIASPPRPHEAYASENQYVRPLRALKSGVGRMRTRIAGLATRRPSSQ
jgi:N-acetyl sugar amidotransferase